MRIAIILILLSLSSIRCIAEQPQENTSFSSYETDPNLYINRANRGFTISYYEPTTYYRADSPPLYNTIYTLEYKNPEYKELFALKTNLLYDIVTFTNIAIEIPIQERWSIEAEYIGSWWQKSSKNVTSKGMAGQLGVNYWLGDRTNLGKLLGWHIGVVGGGGYYDLQLFRELGSQGEFWNIGVTGGYSHPLTKSLRLEYSLAVGVFKNRYYTYFKEYNTEYGDIKAKRCSWDKRSLVWVGPTALKVSLVWMIKGIPSRYRAQKNSR